MGISPTLNIPQARFLAMQNKFKAYVAGFGSGKTWVGCGGICKGMWEHPKINQGYFAPTYPQIRDIFYLCRRPTVNRFINKPPPGGFFYGRNMATATAIKGRKGGSSSSRTPTEQPDDLQSVAKAKILLALGEGEFAGGLTARDIYLDGTALENIDGSQNFSGVAWEFRSGTQAQKYIQGIPGTENEINVGSEVSSSTAWTRTFTNTQLSAVRLRLKWASLFKQEDDGDLVGYSVRSLSAQHLFRMARSPMPKLAISFSPTITLPDNPDGNWIKVVPGKTTVVTAKEQERPRTLLTASGMRMVSSAYRLAN